MKIKDKVKKCCEVCKGSKWVINDDNKTPFTASSINELADGAELIRCWQCNDVSWLLYRQPKTSKIKQTTC
jgi:hypothetical protein